MKKLVSEFFHRGLIACGFGPMVLAILYLILDHQGVLQALTVHEICRGIFSLSALAFIVGGMNAIYQIERLSLMLAILIHGIVLYASYLGTYLINGWLPWGRASLLAFSGIFVLVYLVIWAVIYSVNKRKAEQLNKVLRQKQQAEHN